MGKERCGSYTLLTDRALMFESEIKIDLVYGSTGKGVIIYHADENITKSLLITEI